MVKKEGHLGYIDGLRAVSILAVVAGHYFPTLLPSGFLGVDVFFVISGYVITKYLTESTHQSRLGLLTTFYARRARRLLPALSLSIFCTSILVSFLMPSVKKSVYSAGAKAVLGFSNIQFFQKSQDYFAVNSLLNPFTHTWSLGVEEQFYLLYPAMLLLLGLGVSARMPTRKALVALAFLATFSLAGWFAVYWYDPNAAFYLMPFRFWEIAIGCLTYLLPNRSTGLLSNAARMIALCFLSLLFFQKIIQLPFSNALSCSATSLALITYGIEKNTSPVLSLPWLRYVGNLSYSIYLWHWPVLVLATSVGGLFVATSIFALLLTLMLAAASYHFVENPIRSGIDQLSDAMFLSVSATTALCLAAFVGLFLPNHRFGEWSLMGMLNIADVEAWEESCHDGTDVPPGINQVDYCLSANRSQTTTSYIYLLGDSHAAHLKTMVRSAISGSSYEMRFFTSSSSEDFPQIYFSSSKVAAPPSIKAVVGNLRPGDVVMIALHRGRFNKYRDDHIPLNQDVAATNAEANFYASISSIAQEVTKKGAITLLVRDTPLMANVAYSQSCVLQSRILGDNTCKVTKTQDLHTRLRQDRTYDKLQENNLGVMTWDPLPYIYRDSEVIDVVDNTGTYVMWDWNHITRYQARELAEPFRDELKLISKRSSLERDRAS
jgi:peptidoglycan/LPS O-acetylase OafA/YrhL